MSSDAALHAILKGTGFTVRSDSSGAIAIVRGENVGPTQVSAADSRPTEVAAGAPPQPIAERPAPAIVVTGSRISRRDYKAESPISTMSDATIAAAAQPSLDRVVGQMPQFEAAQGAAEVGDVQGSVGFGGGASYSDLRGVGRNRSLVLMDSRRLMPSTPDGSIDLNTIPTAMIDNLEVITGGASTAYALPTARATRSWISNTANATPCRGRRATSSRSHRCASWADPPRVLSSEAAGARARAHRPSAQ